MPSTAIVLPSPADWMSGITENDIFILPILKANIPMSNCQDITSVNMEIKNLYRDSHVCRAIIEVNDMHKHMKTPIN